MSVFLCNISLIAQTPHSTIIIMRSLSFSCFFSFLVSLIFLIPCILGFGSMGPISASFGDNSLFCAIDASGKQQVICWGHKHNSSQSQTPSSMYPSNLPPMAALSGGFGFLCGILVNTSQAYCWDPMESSSDLVPQIFKSNAYSQVAAGKSHVCGVRGSYYSESDYGNVDCWDVVQTGNNTLSSKQSTLFYDQYVNTLSFKKIVSGDGFSCGISTESGITCWGPNYGSLGIADVSDKFVGLTAGISSVCGILEESRDVKCWSNNGSNPISSPIGVEFVSLTAGAEHFCGIRQDNHAIMCWGNFNQSLIPKASGFLAIASSDSLTCGIREADLVLDCWYVNASAPVDYEPPLELCSPGLCTPGPCGDGKFAFNASLLNELDLTSLCVRKDLKICSPCGMNCSEGFFPSSSCSENADRVCTPCSLCQNSSCQYVCKLPSPKKKKEWDHLLHLALIIGPSVLGILLLLVGWCCVLPRVMSTKNEEGDKKQFAFFARKPKPETEANSEPHPSVSVAPCPEAAQVFRLSELKDATNGFKEFNELGRGSYGFVYKALLPDGRQVAVKRANAATIIHTNSREFEMELEILCNARHGNIVNLLGYCAEMGERILVYEYMPHGTLHDHLHGGLSPLNWSLRLKIAMQASKGLEYLHKDISPPIVHHDVKSSNILLDAEWGARIADFGLLSTNEKDLNGDMKSDVYNFGIVLLEILSGRKPYDSDCTPPSIVEWAVPIIKQGKAAALIDRYVSLPRNVEPLLKLADLAELALREEPGERPNMSYLALSLEQLVKEGLVL